ncbi:unnamed protein product [Brugia timori]|uniref:Uncharacterized protein n=1 Tax=Brugia timori TaxID=42155 RepID=A0A0R3RCK6_9BILA|nr:unnamed protein product [Brugia timori]
MNLSTTISDDVTPTTAREEAVIVDPDVASTSTQLMPKKVFGGIEFKYTFRFFNFLKKKLYFNCYRR